MLQSACYDEEIVLHTERANKPKKNGNNTGRHILPLWVVRPELQDTKHYKFEPPGSPRNFLDRVVHLPASCGSFHLRNIFPLLPSSSDLLVLMSACLWGEKKSIDIALQNLGENMIIMCISQNRNPKSFRGQEVFCIQICIIGLLNDDNKLVISLTQDLL